jgi:hypothetical protein
MRHPSIQRTGGKWTPRPYAPLFGSPPCSCSAQPSPGLWITLFSPRSLPRSVPSPFSAPQPRDPGVDARHWGKPRGLCAMPHSARIVIIAFAFVAASCSAERAQQKSERKETGRQLTAAYYSCVRTSFGSMLPTMVDRNSGIDQSFRVCRTEDREASSI